MGTSPEPRFSGAGRLGIPPLLLGIWIAVGAGSSPLARPGEVAEVDRLVEEATAARSTGEEDRAAALFAEARAAGAALAGKIGARLAMRRLDAASRWTRGESTEITEAWRRLREAEAQQGKAGPEDLASLSAVFRSRGDTWAEGRALCEAVRQEALVRRWETAEPRIARMEEIASGGEAPHVAGCAAYWSGVRRYLGGDPDGARRIFDGFNASPGALEAPRELMNTLIGSSAASIDVADFRTAADRARRALSLVENVGSDADRLRASCNLASALSSLGRSVEGEGHARTCLDLGRALQIPQAEAVGLWRLGDAAYARGDLPSALRLLRGAIEIFRKGPGLRDTAAALSAAAVAERDIGRPHEAIRDFEEAVSLADREGTPPFRARVRAGLAHALAVSGEPDRAARVADEAIALLGPVGNDLTRASALRARGLALYYGQDYGAALPDLGKAHELFGLEGNVSEQAHVSCDLGACWFRLNRLDRALEHYRAAMELGRTSGAVDPQAVAAHNIAVLRQRFGAGEQERIELVEAIRRSTKMGKETSAAIALVNLAGTLLALGEPDDAERTARLAVGRAAAAGRAGTEVEARAVLARAASALARHDEALAACSLALERAGDAPPEARLEALWRCGNVSRAAGRPAEAVERLRSALRSAETARARMTQPELRTTFLTDRTDLYSQLVAAILEAAGPEPGRVAVEEALAVSERYRARGILEALSAEGARGGEAGGDGALESEMDRRRLLLLREMADLHLESAARPGRDTAFLEAMRRLEDRWAETVPSAAARPRLLGAAPAGVETIRASILDAETAAIEFLLGESDSFLFLLDRSKTRVFRLPAARSDLAREVLLCRALLERRGDDPRRDEDAIRIVGERLYRSVLEPAEGAIGPGVRRLVVVPDGPLHALPLEALVRPGGDAGSPPRYLARDLEVTLAPSLTVAVELRHAEEPGEPTSPAFVALANASSAGDAGDDVMVADSTRSTLPVGLPALPYSEEEARRVANLLEERSLVLAGREATEAAARAAFEGGHAVVHMAVHGFLDPLSIGRSGLVLTPDPAAGDDGLLQAREAALLALKADLVVLSGCSTGEGRIAGGEGVLGLPHALFQAGARRIVMSLWSVRDRATAIFMERFYARLAKGDSPGAALRGAKLDLLSSRRAELRHPSVWAPFVLSGIHDGRVRVGPPRRRSPDPLILGIAALVLLAALLEITGRWARRGRSRSGRPGNEPPAPRAGPGPPPAR